ncbi:hypothetical protein GCM10007938_41850 [Vibrio zhanjiangensis]|uniref:Uncharacterized protein n=1 Tax=Vibrio zhanjiangensis TaxID=1046128 RepID=A0ABQ6F6F9_9VIBR|nr:hypothetical protein [Vibrio zhanjiangensis]GLT20401.1 hypothetical protein GCM10007938_41850 [Vibrio zhanjiangensis]
MLRKIYGLLILTVSMTVGANGDATSEAPVGTSVCDEASTECIEKQDANAALKESNQEYYQYLVDQFSQVLPSDIDGLAAVVKEPSNSLFHYWYLNDNLAFNQYTYDYISARVTPSHLPGVVQLSAGKSFNHAYLQVLSGVSFGLSQQTKQQLAEQQKELETLASDLVDVYEYAFNPITPEQIDKAHRALESYKITIETKLDYVVDFVVAYKWSGRLVQDKRPLPFIGIAQASNLSQILPDIPASGAGVLQKLGLYLHSYRVINAMNNGFQHNAAMLNASISNVQSPSKERGGIKTFNPVDGLESERYQPRYDIGVALAAIANSLANRERTLRLTLRIAASKDNIGEQDLPGVITGKLIFIDELGRSIDLNLLTKTGSVTMDIAYQGYAYLPIQKASLSADGQSGWYFSDPIWQSIQHQGQDETGYQFAYQPAFHLSCHHHDGNFASLTGVLIANSPKVVITFDSNSEVLASLFEQTSGQGKLQFDGEWIKHGIEQRSYRYQMAEGTEGQKTLIFTSDSQLASASQANSLQVSIPSELKTADVLLVTYQYPAAEGNGTCPVENQL